MDYNFLRSYRAKKINHQKLHSKILSHFTDAGESVDKMRLYDEILFVLDERSPSGKASRGVCDQLFNQTKNKEEKTSISKMAWAYIENLQTAKLCLLRDEHKIADLKSRPGTTQDRANTFVHLQIVQVSVYSRMTKDATLSYCIQPSSIPPVTLQNAINPLLNHQFTFKLEEADYFSIIVMDSGIGIGQWRFPDEPGLKQGQYHRLVTSENLTLEVKIKYLPKNSNREKVELSSELKQVEGQKAISKAAFENLVVFEPFLNQQSKMKVAPPPPEPQKEEEEEDDYVGCFAFIGSHVRNLYVLLVCLIVAESLFSYYSAVEFIDMMLAFYLIGILYNKQVDFEKERIRFLIIGIAFVLCILKSFLGMASLPFYHSNGVKVVMLIICLILKIAVIVALIVCANHLTTMATQRNSYFYAEDYQPAPKEVPKVQTEEEYDIYQSVNLPRY